jgi:hypothetical protein
MTLGAVILLLACGLSALTAWPSPPWVVVLTAFAAGYGAVQMLLAFGQHRRHDTEPRPPEQAPGLPPTALDWWAVAIGPRDDPESFAQEQPPSSRT